MGANETWLVRLVLLFNSNTTADLAVDYTIPSGASGKHHSSNQNASSFSIGTELPIGGLNADAITVLTVLVKNGSTPGNFQLIWAQDVQNASDTTVKANSCIVAHRLG